MIRMIQRRLIIPRGDTGSFSIPCLKTIKEGDVAVFTIFDPKTHTKFPSKIANVEGDKLNIAFSHNDTVNLKPGKYLWDIKIYTNPQVIDDELINGDEIDSYYAGFSLPECEIRETADNYLVSDSGLLSSNELNIITDILTEIRQNVIKTEENVSHYPTIRNGTWHLWDAEQSIYVNTNIPVSGNGDSSNPGNFIFDFSPTRDSLNPVTSDGIYNAIINIKQMNIHICNSNEYDEETRIPTIQEPDLQTFYLVPKINNENENDNFVQWLYVDNDWEIFGNIEGDLNDYIKFTDLSSIFSISNNNITINTNRNHGVEIASNQLQIAPATSSDIKTPNLNIERPITPNKQHEAVFYGLANAAGVSESNSNFSIGTYTNEAKAAIQEMLDVPSKSNIDTVPTENSLNLITSGGVYNAIANINTMNIHICTSNEYNEQTGTPTVQNPNESTFYLVPSGEGTDMFSEWIYTNNKWERFGSGTINLDNYALKNELPTKVSDLLNDSEFYTKPENGIPLADLANGVISVQDVVLSNRTSLVNNGIATIPYAQDSSGGGIVKLGNVSQHGLSTDASGYLDIIPATATDIKTGDPVHQPITPGNLPDAIFYGLAAVAGDTTQKASRISTIGQYTDEAKLAIQQMLDVPKKADVPTKVSDLLNDNEYVTDSQQKDLFNFFGTKAENVEWELGDIESINNEVDDTCIHTNFLICNETIKFYPQKNVEYFIHLYDGKKEEIQISNNTFIKRNDELINYLTYNPVFYKITARFYNNNELIHLNNELLNDYKEKIYIVDEAEITKANLTFSQSNDHRGRLAWLYHTRGCAASLGSSSDTSYSTITNVENYDYVLVKMRIRPRDVISGNASGLGIVFQSYYSVNTYNSLDENGKIALLKNSIVGSYRENIGTSDEYEEEYRLLPIPPGTFYMSTTWFSIDSEREHECYLIKLPKKDKQKGYIFGDSFISGTDGSGASYNMTKNLISDTINKKLNIELCNKGRGGMGWLYRRNTCSMIAFEEILATDITDADIVVLCFGANDGKKPIGTIADIWQDDWHYELDVDTEIYNTYIGPNKNVLFDNDGVPILDEEFSLESTFDNIGPNKEIQNTIMYQISKCIKYIYTQSPYCKVILVGPWNQTLSGTDTESWSQPYEYTYTSSSSRYQLAETMKQFCEKYGVAFIDFRECNVINGFNLYNIIGYDNHHPCDEGYRLLGEWLAARIKTIIG